METALGQRVHELVECGWEPLTTTETTASLVGRRPFNWWLFLMVLFFFPLFGGTGAAKRSTAMSHLFIVLAVLASLTTTAWAETRSARSFDHSVTTTAARVEPPTGDKSYISIRCWQASASPVYLGGKDVTRRNGYAICTNNPQREADPRADSAWTCQTDFISLDVSDLYAVVSNPPGAPESPAMQSLSCIIVQ